MKFLNNLDLLQNQLQNAVIHLVANVPAASGQIGQIAYDSAKDILYIYTDDGWTIIPTIKTLAADPSTGNVAGEIYFDTENGILKVFDGAAWKSVGKLVTNGTKGAQTGTSGLTFGGDGSTVTIAHASVTTTPATSTAAPNYEGTFTAIDGLTIDNGHVTGYNTKTITLPDDTLYDISVVDPTVGDASIRLHDTLGNNDDITFVGSNITITPTDENTITITHPSLTPSETSNAGSLSYAGTFSALDSIDFDSMGHVSAVNTKTFTMPADTLYNVSVVDDLGVKIRLADTLANTDDIKFTGTTIDVTRVDENTINLAHADTSTATSITGLTEAAVISGVEVDGYGHVTALTQRNITAANIGADLETVTDVGATTSNAISITNETDTVALGTGALIVSGGVSVAKNLRVGGSLTVDGTLTAVNSNEVNIGDSDILLNADITSSAQNSDGGITVKRFNAAGERKDAALTYDNTAGRWEQTFGSVEATQVTATIASKVSATIGNDSAVNFTITHNLNSRDLIVNIRETAADYELVQADVEFTTLDTITVRFAVKPAVNEYTVTIIG